MMGMHSKWGIRGKLLIHNTIAFLLLVFVLVLAIYANRSNESLLRVKGNLSAVSTSLRPLSRYAVSVALSDEDFNGRKQAVDHYKEVLLNKVDTLLLSVRNDGVKKKLAPLVPSVDTLLEQLNRFDEYDGQYVASVGSVQDALKRGAVLVTESGLGGREAQRYAEISVDVMGHLYDEEIDDDEFSQIVNRLRGIKDLAGVQETSEGMSFSGLIDTLQRVNGHMNSYILQRNAILRTVNSIETIIAGAESLEVQVVSAMQRKIHVIYWVVFIVVSVVLYFFSRRLAQNLAVPLQVVSSVLQRYRDGDIAEVGERWGFYNRNDEVGVMAQSLGELGVKLREVLGQMHEVGASLIEANAQLTQSAGMISEGASRQASESEQVSSTVEEMTASMQQTSDNAQQCETINAKSMNSLAHLRETMEQSAEVVASIGERIGVMNGIAQQTNILALNAAVEAARAGEHGRGFAVVAAEVRKLAEQSAKAADEVVGLVRNAVKVADEATQEFNAISPDLQEASRLTQEVSAAAQQQRIGTDQINTSVQELTEVAQGNAASSEELAASAENLKDMADRLNELLGYYHMEEKA